MEMLSPKRIVCAALLGLMASASLATASQAAPFMPAPAMTVETNITTVQYHRGDRADRRHDLRYDRRHHGERHRHRRPGYTHFHGGYYYATPWWAGPAIVVAPPRHVRQERRAYRDTKRHIRWCTKAYRNNYNPHSNLFIARDGRRYECNSPFS